MASSPVRGPVVLTREPPDNDRLRELLEAEGFAVLEWPATRAELRTPPGAGAELIAAMDRSALTVFTTRRAVRAVEQLSLIHI